MPGNLPYIKKTKTINNCLPLHSTSVVSDPFPAKNDMKREHWIGLLLLICWRVHRPDVTSSADWALNWKCQESGAGVACWLKRRTSDQKTATSNPGRSAGKIFFSWVNFVCWFLLGIRSTPVLSQWHVKDPGHSAKSAGGRLHLNTPLTQRSRSGMTMPLSRQSVKSIRKRAHTQLDREHSVTVVSARWATVDWTWPKEWN